ncbi:MAG: amidohydrolase family protein [Novosphingobium sp.]
MSPRFALRALGALVAATCAATAMAQDFAVTNARVVIGDGSEPVENGTVVVRGGKVAAAGAGVAVPAGIRVIDAGGKWVTPGLVAALTDLGLLDVNGVEESNDHGPQHSLFNAALDVAPAVNPTTVPITVNRAGGVTRAAVAPASGNAIFAGQGAVIDLGSDPHAVTGPRAFQFVEMGERGGRLAGGSRVAAHASLRNALAEARDVAANPTTRRDDALLTRRDAEALVPVIQGRQPLYVHVERAHDIRAILALKTEFPALKLVIVGADEGWMAAREIAEAGVPVIANPLTDLPASFESLAATQSNVGRMAAAGVKVAVGNLSDMRQPRYTPQYAGNLVALNRVPGATGLSWAKAFAAISSIPADILGQGERFGSLRPGRAGDVVIWDGDPLEVISGPVAVFIDGIEQPLANHQTRLRDRYATPGEGTLPKAYE